MDNITGGYMIFLFSGVLFFKIQWQIKSAVLCEGESSPTYAERSPIDMRCRRTHILHYNKYNINLYSPNRPPRCSSLSWIGYIYIN